MHIKDFKSLDNGLEAGPDAESPDVSPDHAGPDHAGPDAASPDASLDAVF